MRTIVYSVPFHWLLSAVELEGGCEVVCLYGTRRFDAKEAEG